MTTKLLLHGVPETAAIWTELIAELSVDGDVRTLSLPGFGTPRPDGFDCSMQAYAAWLTAEVDAAADALYAARGPAQRFGGSHAQRDLIDQTLLSAAARGTRRGIGRALGEAPGLIWIDAHLDALLARDPAALAHAVKRSCEIKAWVVGQDEREAGLRAILNFGHTFGHAIEAGMGYGAWLHGEAVAAGMVLAAETSRLLGWISEADVARVTALIERAGLPILSPDLGVDAWISHMGHDKKVEEGQLRFVLLRQLGQAVIEKGVPLTVLREVLQGRFIRRA